MILGLCVVKWRLLTLPPHARYRTLLHRGGVMTLEMQRQRAKEMRAYFLEQKTQEAIIKAQ